MGKTKENANQKYTRRAEYALLALGIALLSFWGVARVESSIRSRVSVREFNAFALPPLDSADSIRVPGGASGTAETIPRPSGGKRIQVQLESSSEWADAPLAMLRIPKIRLEVPVLEGTDRLTLNHAVGRIAGTARMGELGNIGIAGHRDGFFRRLKDLTVGDTVELRTLTGTVAYKVDQVSVVSPEDVSVLNHKSGRSLTLVTCYPFYFVGRAPQRYIVSASPEPMPEVVLRSAFINPGQFH